MSLDICVHVGRQETGPISIRVYRGLFYLSVQVLVADERQELVPFVDERQELDPFVEV